MSQLPQLSPRKGSSNSTSRPDSKSGGREDCLAPGPVCLPGLEQARNPILGSMVQYSRYSPKAHIPSSNGSKYKSNYHKVVHSGSMFEDTSVRRNFYIIAPDWPSEARTARRLAAKQRSHYSWDSRPAFHPLHDYVIPMLERRRSCESRINEALQSARESVSRGKPVDSHARTSMQALPPTQFRDEPTARSLPTTHAQGKDYPRPVPNGSQFYKSMLASEILAPRRELTCPNLVHY